METVRFVESHVNDGSLSLHVIGIYKISDDGYKEKQKPSNVVHTKHQHKPNPPWL